MQNPETGELVPVPGDDLRNVPPNWKVYEVGSRVKLRGWWWEIMSVEGGQLTIKPVMRSITDRSSGKRSRIRALTDEIEGLRAEVQVLRGY